MIFDKYNLPGHRQKDGSLDFGDCCHNVGRIAVLKYLLSEDFKEEYLQRVSWLITKDRFLRRHPDQWNDPKDVSSDATEPIIMANLVSDYKSLNWIILKNLKDNYFRYQNSTDILRPHHLSMWGRFLNKRLIYYVGDVFTFLFVLYRQLVGSRLKNKEGNYSVSDDINLILMVRLFRVYKHTFLIRLSLFIYTRVDFCIAYYFKGRSGLGDYLWDLFSKEKIKNG